MKKICRNLIIVVAVMLCSTTVFAKSSSNMLSKPMIGSVLATDKASVKIVWIPVKNAQKYEVYRATSQKGKYNKIATTNKTSYTDKKGKQLTTYYYKVRAVRKNIITNKNVYSAYSIVMKKKVRKVAKKTAYAGDSLMVGLIEYGKIKETKSRKVFAQIGISTKGYYQSDLLTELVKYKPDRLYIMLGVNDIAGNPSISQMNMLVSYYKAILKACIAKNPNMEIFVLGVSPVGKKSSISMDKVNYYNVKLERQLLKLKNVYYYDLALELAGDDGYLQPQYVSSDGLHWTPKAYDVVLKAMKEMVKAY